MAVDRLTAEDRLMLWSDESWPQDIGALAVLDGSPLLEPDGQFRLEVAREAIERRLHLLPRSLKSSHWRLKCLPLRPLKNHLLSKIQTITNTSTKCYKASTTQKYLG